LGFRVAVHLQPARKRNKSKCETTVTIC